MIYGRLSLVSLKGIKSSLISFHVSPLIELIRAYKFERQYIICEVATRPSSNHHGPVYTCTV